MSTEGAGVGLQRGFWSTSVARAGIVTRRLGIRAVFGGFQKIVRRGIFDTSMWNAWTCRCTDLLCPAHYYAHGTRWVLGAHIIINIMRWSLRLEELNVSYPGLAGTRACWVTFTMVFSKGNRPWKSGFYVETLFRILFLFRGKREIKGRSKFFFFFSLSI